MLLNNNKNYTTELTRLSKIVIQILKFIDLHLIVFYSLI